MEETIFNFNDKCTENNIEFEKSELVAWINNYNIDPKNCKLFILLLKSSFEEMIKKGCEYYQQIVLESEWDEFIHFNKEWTIINKFDEKPKTLLICCDINIACELIVDGFLRNNNTF
jgi:hypothetical protein